MNPSRPTSSVPASSSHLPRLFHPSEIPWSKVAKFAVPLLLVIVAGIFLYAVRWARSVSESKPDDARKTMTLRQLQEHLMEVVPHYPTEPLSFIEVKYRHGVAKDAFEYHLKSFIDSEVSYCSAEGLSLRDHRMEPLIIESQTKVLDSQVFCWSRAQEDTVIAASFQSDEIHLFCVDSLYNAGEATEPRTSRPGFAMPDSENDFTQGPFFQRTNPRLFELMNAYLANGGFNMLARVLTETSMKAFQHGYLVGIDANCESSVAADFQDLWSRLEQVCVSSHPEGGGPYPIYLMMAAAPCYDETKPYGKIFDQNNVKKIQFYAALANYTAQLFRVFHLAKQNPGKKVVYHAAGVGLEVFKNDPKVVGDAFRVAAFHFQKILQKNVQVQFDVFTKLGVSDERAMACVQHLGLMEEQPIPTSEHA